MVIPNSAVSNKIAECFCCLYIYIYISKNLCNGDEDINDVLDIVLNWNALWICFATQLTNVPCFLRTCLYLYI